MPNPRAKSVEPPKQEEQKLAKSVLVGINILDMDKINPAIRPKLINGKVDLDGSKIIQMGVEDRILVFTCPLLPAALTIDLIRNENRAEGDTPCRCYIKVGDTQWRKLNEYAILTELEGGKAILNKDYFPIVVEALPFAPKPAERVVLGRKR